MRKQTEKLIALKILKRVVLIMKRQYVFLGD